MNTTRKILAALCAILLIVDIFVLTRPPSKSFLYTEAIYNNVLIEASDGYGSGVVVYAHGNTYVWTCAHVMTQMPKTPVEALNALLSGKPLPVFQTAKVTIHGKVYQASTVDCGGITSDTVDVAVLRVWDAPTPLDSTKFSSAVPTRGQPVYHVGNAEGLEAPDTLAVGVSTYPDRLVQGRVEDQYQLPILPGCSGGGVYDYRGKCIGLVRERLGYDIAYTVPTREIRKWAEKEGLLDLLP